MSAKISVYCDGSSSGGGVGAIGWGWLITDQEVIFTAGCGGGPTGTNNVAELQAAIHGLQAVLDRKLHIGTAIELVSDSTYALGLANGSYQPQKHLELVESLRSLYQETRAVTRWVRGHSGEPFNEQVDQLAKYGRDRYIEPGAKKHRGEERKRKRAILRGLKQKDRDDKSQADPTPDPAEDPRPTENN